MATTNIYDMADTWNAGGTTFTAIKMNVTNTASAAGSMVMDLQVGGSSVFRVSKDQGVRISGSGTAGTGFVADPSLYFIVDNVQAALLDSSRRMRLPAVGALCWTDSAVTDTMDLFLYRDAAGVLAQRNSTNAQAFRIYNTYTDGSNYEYFGITWSGNVVTVGGAAAGTGSNRDIYYQSSRNLTLRTVGGDPLYLGTNGTNRWTVDATGGHLLASTDNTYDIGASGATRPRDLHLARQLVMSSGTITDSKPLFDLAQTWNDGTEAFTALKLNVTDTASAAASLLMDLQVGGSSKVNVSKSGQVTLTKTDEALTLNAGHAYLGNGVKITTTGYIQWDSQAWLYSDAANVLAQRNGANAQAFRVYNTYTDGSNYERGALEWSGNVLCLGSKGAGTGTDKLPIIIIPGGPGATAYQTVFASTAFEVKNASSTTLIKGSSEGVTFGAGLIAPTVTKTADYTATANDFTIRVDATSAAVTITLPAAASHTGRLYRVKKVDASANAVTIDGNAAETIDGAATKALAAQFDSYTIQSNGTNWDII